MLKIIITEEPSDVKNLELLTSAENIRNFIPLMQDLYEVLQCVKEVKQPAVKKTQRAKIYFNF